MRTPASAPTAKRPSEGGFFDDVVVGIDETFESLVAAVQARVLRTPAGRLVLLAVAETYLAAHAGAAGLRAADDLVADTSTELERARALVEPDDARLTSGRLVERLCAECGRDSTSLVAVGVRPHRRLTALTFGGHEVEALHDVPCSVLVARPGWGPSKPDRIVVGVGASPEARAAEAVARSLAARLGCQIVPVVGVGDNVDVAILEAERDDAVLDPRGLADAVVGASSKSGLVVVGRGRASDHRWGGSVVERVVYHASCSVLVVRDDAGRA